MRATHKPVQHVRNVGMNKGTPRIWLEGVKLDAVGFYANVRYSKIVKPQTLTLTLDPEGDFKVSSKKATGKNPPEGYRMPVIDLHNAGLGEWLDGATSVTITYHAEGCITLKRNTSQGEA